MIPIDGFRNSLRFKYTPSGNRDFYPANTFHYDLEILDKNAFGIDLLNALRNRSAKWSLLGEDGKFVGRYTLQARVAYSHCVQQFGYLDPAAPPLGWKGGKSLDAREQVNTIDFLTQSIEIEK